MAQTVFAQPGDGKVTDMGGSRRRVVIALPELMVVEFSFDTGAVGAPHSHPHVQSSYIASGVFDVTIDGVTGAARRRRRLMCHRARCTASSPSRGVLIDNFTPRRDDFL